MKKVLIMIVVVLVLGTSACKQIGSTELGVRVWNMPPLGAEETTLKTGAYLYIPFFYDIYILPKNRQNIEMVEKGEIQFKEVPGQPIEADRLFKVYSDLADLPQAQMDQVKKELSEIEEVQIVVHDRRSGNRSLRIKTADGNDAWVDVRVIYQVRPDTAYLVIEKVGTSAEDMKLLVAAIVRGTLRSWLSELDSEAILKQPVREAKITENLDDLNKELDGYGINILQINTPGVDIHPAYDEILSQKRVAEEEKIEYLAYQDKAKIDLDTKVNTAKGDAYAMEALANGRLQRTLKEGDAELEAKRLEAEGMEIKYNELGRGIATQTALLGGAGGDAQVALAIAESITGKPIVIVPSTGAVNTLDVNEIIQTYGGIKALSKGQDPAPQLNPIICPMAQTAPAAQEPAPQQEAAAETGQ